MNLARRLGLSRYKADDHYRRAIAATLDNDRDSAIRCIDAALDLLPSHAEYHAARGWILREFGDSSGANAAFERALELNPLDMLSNYAGGMRAYRAKDWDRAEAAFINCLAAQPDRPETLTYLALIRHRRHDNAKALEWMRAAQAGFAKADDKREADCRAWIREFDMLLSDSDDA